MFVCKQTLDIKSLRAAGRGLNGTEKNKNSINKLSKEREYQGRRHANILQSKNSNYQNENFKTLM